MRKTTLLALSLLLASLAADAWAGGRFYGGGRFHGGVRYGPRVGVFIGPPVVFGGFGYGAPVYGSSFYGPSLYGAPYYGYPYYAPPAVVAATPPVYVQQGGQPVDPSTQASWYYCADPAGYYPTVADCPGGWQAVPAR